MNVSQRCNFMGMVSLQQDKPQHMMHFPLLPTILSTLSTSYLAKPLSDGLNSTLLNAYRYTMECKVHVYLMCFTDEGRGKSIENILIEKGGERDSQTHHAPTESVWL